jgi:hypothetical protein
MGSLAKGGGKKAQQCFLILGQSAQLGRGWELGVGAPITAKRGRGSDAQCAVWELGKRAVLELRAAWVPARARDTEDQLLGGLLEISRAAR